VSKYKAIFDKQGLLAEFEDGEMVYLREEYSPPEKSDLASPMIMRDIEPYQNMINGGIITSRSEHRELLKRHNCVEVGNEKMQTKVTATPNNRRELISRQLGDMSDKQANKVLKQLKNGI
jgi:hypothetical protein